MNFSPKILELGVGIFGIVFPNPGSCLTNCFGPETDVYRFCCEFGIGIGFKQFRRKLGLLVDCVCCADV